MNKTKLLLNAYYEVLYERLEANKDLLAARIEKLLWKEIERCKFGDFDREKYEAYRDACLAFVDERIETYNPIGVQYTFDNNRRREAFELELQLNWYDSRTEFETLVQAAKNKVEVRAVGQDMPKLANELVEQVGAFPDKSIISGYESEPTVGRLPDYVVARAIEETIR